MITDRVAKKLNVFRGQVAGTKEMTVGGRTPRVAGRSTEKLRASSGGRRARQRERAQCGWQAERADTTPC